MSNVTEPAENPPAVAEPIPPDDLPITKAEPNVETGTQPLSPAILDDEAPSIADDAPSIDDNAPSTKGSGEASRSGAPKREVAKVDNPFELLERDEVNEKVAGFVKDIPELHEHRRILQLGAQLKREDEFIDDPYFLKKQKDYLVGRRPKRRLPRKGKPKSNSAGEEEKEGDERVGERRFGVWRQSKFLKGTLLTVCLAGIVQGWTQSAMNGANIGITDEFNIHHKEHDEARKGSDAWLFGILNAIPFLAGGSLAPFVSDPLQEHLLGRRGAMAVACVISIAATVGQAFSKNPAQLIVCRLITGITLAAKASAAPLLTAEIAPDHLRGNLLSTWQLSDAFGIFLGFASNLAISSAHSPKKIIWRIQTAMALIPTFALLLVVYLMPESPRYLMKRGKYAKALESFTLLRPPPVSNILGGRDFIYAHFQLQTECEFEKGKASIPAAVPPTDPNADTEKGTTHKVEKPLYDISRTHFYQRLRQTFYDGRSRRALVCASTAMISQQLCGINTIAFLSGTILTSQETSDRDSAWVGFGIGLCNLIFGLPSFWLLDRLGRATMLLIGFPFMFILMLILAFGFKAGGDAHNGLIGAFGILFIIAYSPTAGPVPFAISAEVFPLVIREVGHSIAVLVNFVGLGVILLLFQPLERAMGSYTAILALFAALNVIAFILCFLFVPETKNRTLEELQFIFDRPFAEHIEYRCKVVAPWLAKKYLRPTACKLHLWYQGRNKPVGDLLVFHRWPLEGAVPKHNKAVLNTMPEKNGKEPDVSSVRDKDEPEATK